MVFTCHEIAQMTGIIDNEGLEGIYRVILVHVSMHENTKRRLRLDMRLLLAEMTKKCYGQYFSNGVTRRKFVVDVVDI